MRKNFLYLLLILPLLVFCTNKTAEPTPDGKEPEGEQKEPEKETEKEGETGPYALAAPEISLTEPNLATNPNAEKFLVEVNYSDTDISTTEVLKYYGGFNCVKYDENGNEDPNGEVVKKPKSDRPQTYSIRWEPHDNQGTVTIHMADNRNWEHDYSVTNGQPFLDITNLVPNTTYTFKVTEGETTLKEGTFTTTGHLHQVFFKNACRNGRDLGGWTGLNGKTVKYRLIYRGGRMETNTINNLGRKELAAENIGAQLDIRGTSDVLKKPVFSELEFCAPVIEQGGTYMLEGSNADGNYVGQCFKFILNNVKAGKGTYFHCSLGRDRTGTLATVLLGVLGVKPGDISKEYEITYFAPMGYSVSSSEDVVDGVSWADRHPDLAAKGLFYPYFLNTRNLWVFSQIHPYFWNKAKEVGPNATFADGVEKYLTEIAGITKDQITEFRNLMLE